MEAGYLKANSTNLPRIDVFMVYQYIKEDDRFNAAEMRGIKTSAACRETYGDAAVGYVCVKREGSKCTLKAKICPEHRVRSKSYSVTLIVDEEEQKVLSVECHDCAAASGGCKHSIAFLMWVHRRTENPAPTEVACYWKKAVLSTIGTTKKYIETKELYKKEIQNIDFPDNTTFLQDIVEIAKQKQLDSQLSRHNFELKERRLYSLSVHRLIVEFSSYGTKTVDDFLIFCTSKMSQELCFEAENATQIQSDSLLWFELRYGRITASILHEAANCNTEDGSLVQRITGASKVYDTKEMERGRHLEKKVIKEVEKIIGQKLKKCGIFLMPNFPILGASPDALGDNFIVEVKCPNSDKAISRFVSKGEITSKYKAQINLQMLATNTKRGLFCVANPDFENNKKVTTIWIDYDKDYTTAIIKQAINFWKKNIYYKLMNSISK